MLLGLLAFAGEPAKASEHRWGFVDGASLIRMHPLIKQYDPTTRRFRNTVSQPRPSEDPAAYIARLQLNLNEINNTLKQLDANYAGKLSGRGMVARNAWWSFWKKRESLRIYQKLLQEAIAQASVHGNFYLNMPSDWTLMPVAIAIAASVNDACEYLREGSKLDAIFDVSVFKSQLDSKSALNFIPNPHWKIWQQGIVDQSALEQTGDSLAATLRQSFPRLRNRPFVAGATDLRQLAEALLSDITLPSADLPGADSNPGE